ncbi:MAG TPA: ATP-binding protein [Nitrospirales bacterium]|nr:ATP-binding protein [Nitrospirales bacterium]
MRPFKPWWSGLRVHHKVLAILVAVFTPLVLAVAVHVTLVSHLQSLQHEQENLLLAREQVHILRRLAVRIEDGFRGYLLTEQESFLEPLRESEPNIDPTVQRIVDLVAKVPDLDLNPGIRSASNRVQELLVSKHALIDRVRAGHLDEVLAYVRSGRGLVLSGAVLDDLRRVEDELDARLRLYGQQEVELAQRAFWGLVAAGLGGIALGMLAARLLARSITAPIGDLQAWTAALTASLKSGTAPPDALMIKTADELGHLTISFQNMAARVRKHIAELEAIIAIGHDMNTIGADGLDGVLHRITTQAADLLGVDACLVMLRHEGMGCWVIEAASGPWHDRLQKSVMLWEEFPVSVQAFDTKAPALGEEMRGDLRPQVVRRNMLGESMLAVPLLSQGEPFGVLVLLMNRAMPAGGWNVGLASRFADDAAVAIRNARLYEEVQEKGKGLQSRLRYYEYMAEMLAHDLKAPGERVTGLATMLRERYSASLDEHGRRWLQMMDDNGKELTERVRGLLEVARLGAHAENVGAIDPSVVINDVLKSCANEIDSAHAHVDVQHSLPLVPCHRAYLRQIFENLILNALKFSQGAAKPEIRVRAVRQADRVCFTVSDNGPGIPESQRERVFEPFVRLKPDLKGSGIGLTIVKRIVELYGGRIWIESPPEGGCAVQFTLPVLGELDLTGTSGLTRTEHAV